MSSTKVNLEDLVKNSPDYVDNTDGIRKQKHSKPIQDDLRLIDQIREKYSKLEVFEQEQFANECRKKCQFLFNNYTDIFNRAVANELDYSIMAKILYILKSIEDGKVDQNNGSVLVGQLLKELYVDSAVKRSEKLDQEYASDRVEFVEPKNVSWKDYKRMQK